MFIMVHSENRSPYGREVVRYCFCVSHNHLVRAAAMIVVRGKTCDFSIGVRFFTTPGGGGDVS